jgi:hypothetical protein
LNFSIAFLQRFPRISSFRKSDTEMWGIKILGTLIRGDVWDLKEF